MSMLILLFTIPFVAAALIYLVGTFTSRHLKALAVTLSLVPLVLLIAAGKGLVGTSLQYEWIPTLSVNFHLAVDGVTLLFLFLTAIVIPISLMAERAKHLSEQRAFYALVLILQGILFLFFMARDLVLFLVCWEAMLIPLYFIIAGWGSGQSYQAAIKFLIYMIAGSVLMIAGVLALYLNAGANTFNIDELSKSASAAPYAAFICAVFLLAFAVKTPLFPFHAWLPDAYCQAPVGGTILLSAILSKAGIYGFIRVAIPFFPQLIKEWSPILLALAIAGTLYGALVAWRQDDYKRLLAYSSFSHVNFVLAGLFVWNEPAQTGAILQAINHGITIAALFLAAGWLEERLQTTQMGPSGLAKYLPKLCWITLIFVLSGVALPGTNTFVGEFLVLYGLFGLNALLAAILGLTVIFTVVYLLKWMQTTYFGKVAHHKQAWTDIGIKELGVALPIAALIFWIGIYPAPLLSLIKPAAATVASAAHVEPS